MNVDLLEEVKHHILEEPKRLNMRWFGVRVEFNDVVALDRFPACGTVACIAGWAIILSKPGLAKDGASFVEAMRSAEESGAVLLGITLGKAQRLFYTVEWPWAERWAYEEAERSNDFEGMAKATAQRIDSFIVENGGAQ